ncbi:MAG TPA: hypothetical protein VGR24_03600 [bacterium]|jgi:hypothetical protein|nr:hypothetical protein [bacterium]
MGRWLAVALCGIVLASAAPISAQTAPVPVEVIAKNLAENVLGEGLVRRVQVAQNGRYIEIDWEAALYRTTNSQARNREQLKGEAQLATGSIMGVLKPALIVFRIWVGPKTIVTGRRHNDGRFIITYAKELGG